MKKTLSAFEISNERNTTVIWPTGLRVLDTDKRNVEIYTNPPKIVR